MNNLRDTYDHVLDLLLDEAKERGFATKYAYGNESGKETPEGFYYEEGIIEKTPWIEYLENGKLIVEIPENVKAISLRGTKLFNLMVYGTQDQLRETLEKPELHSEYLKEIFGPYDDKKIEEQIVLEQEITSELKGEKEEGLKEAA